MPISIIGTLSRLAGLRSGVKVSGGLFKPVVSRFSVYLLYHLVMFGLWFLLANVLIGRLYQSPTDYSGTNKPQLYQQDEADSATVNRAEIYSSDGTNNGLRAPEPNEDRMHPNKNRLPSAPILEKGVCFRTCEPYSLGSDPYPPYDPIYTKSDILSATYLLILIYPWLFVGYIIIWALFSTNIMYLIRQARGKKPFAPTLKLYIRLTVWNAVIFGIIAGFIHHFALY